MSKGKNSRLLPITPLVVGTVHSAGSLAAALRATPSALDVLEFRVDAFAPDPRALLAAAARVKLPLMVTVRHPLEGGVHSLNARQRRELYFAFLPSARFIDVELRSVEALADVIAAARERKIGVIVSSHDFRRTPPTAELQRRALQARRAGAAIFKVATVTRTPADLTRLVALFANPSPVPLSVMGMGPLGKVSRLLFGRLGSRLNYGYLHHQNADGQWAARELKSRLREL
jgi:3-dehydroquinate dehydratase I